MEVIGAETTAALRVRWWASKDMGCAVGDPSERKAMEAVESLIGDVGCARTQGKKVPDYGHERRRVTLSYSIFLGLQFPKDHTAFRYYSKEATDPRILIKSCDLLIIC
jgi:hypothetical protein